VINLAETGATIADVESNQIDDLKDIHADLITLNVGANDATHFTDFLDFDHHMSIVMTEMTQYPTTVVAVANTPDLACVPALQPILNEITAWRARRQNAMLRDLCYGSSVQLVDLYSQGKLIGKANYAGDQFHPSAQGYAKWASLFEPVAKSIGS
jgi:lysophospholipase L1-like esterase